MQWRNDTPVTPMNGCDLWSRWGKILNGVANVTKHDAGQLTIDESFVPLTTVATEAQREMLRYLIASFAADRKSFNVHQVSDWPSRKVIATVAVR
ncbi:hypothetical protein M5G27_12415 [Pseudomonas shahriarae]|uniref:Uncharacterized protein n=1 Tax=Pseudomonas shahriarae TaxID=2745512 RepID=A0A9X4C1N3_9PSED|nr:hypothetical protein [Pseudomonas shahriarae]MDD1008270.1 hypothetical protein [Pseudomonas shahriarae]